MLVIESGSTRRTRFVQPKNAAVPITSAPESGNRTVVRAVQCLNASVPILVIESVITTEVREVQSRNASLPMLVIESGMTTCPDAFGVIKQVVLTRCTSRNPTNTANQYIVDRKRR
jgi:hypothetical protein